MSRIVAALASALLLAAPALAGPPEDDAAQALRDFAAKLDEIGSLAPLDETLPLTSQSLAEAFGLGSIFGSSLGALADPGSLADLEAKIGEASTTVNGVTINFLSPTVTENGGFVDIDFTMQVTASNIGLPLEVAVLAGALEDLVTGGGAPTNLDLLLPLSFRLDTTVADATERFFLDYPVTPPAATLAVDAIGGATFPANLGFLEVSVAPTFGFDFDFVAQLNDPDSDGRITIGEVETTDIADLFTLTIANQVCPDNPATPIAGASILLSATSFNQLSGNSSLTYAQSCFENGFDPALLNPVVPVWSNDIREFIANVSPTSFLQGLSVLAASLRSAQLGGDLPIPFVQQSLAEAFTFTEPIVAFLERFSDAAIVCGTVNEDPPRGNVLDLVPGATTIYCQAIAAEDPTPGSVRWGIGAPTDAAADSTVGQNPTQNFEFTASGTTLPDIVVEFQDSAGDTKTVHRRFLSVQELEQTLVDGVLGEFDPSVTDLVAYDAASDLLTFHLRRTFTPSVPAELEQRFDFGDQLKRKTGLSGVGATGGASVSVTPGSATLDVVFGIEISDDYDPGCMRPPDGSLLPADRCVNPGLDPADPMTADRFFLQSPSGALLKLDGVDSAFTVDLRGKVGLLEIQATSPGGFNLGKQAGNGDPIVALDLDFAGADPVGSLANAIRLRQLLREVTSRNGGADPGRIQPAFNLGFSGQLDVQAIGAGLELAAGGVALGWQISNPQDVADGPDITADLAFSDNLKIFDLEPPLFGTHTGSDGSEDPSVPDVLLDAAQAFSTDLEAATLRNLSDGSQCVIAVGGFDPGEPNELTCDLEGGDENRWHTGDRYEVGGNPQAILSVILDNLEAVLVELLSDENAFLDERIPLIGRSARQLIAKIDELTEQLDEFRSLRPLGSVVCRREEGGEMFGVLNLGDQDEFLCQGLQLLPVGEVTAVQWSCQVGTGAEFSCAVTENGDSLDTVGRGDEPGMAVTPTLAARFKITKNAGADPDATYDLGDDFTVRLSFGDGNGTHPLDLPPMELTLQNLGDLLACQLGLPGDVLALSLTAPDVLNVGLGYGICTSGHPDAATCATRFDVGAIEGRLRLPLDDLQAGVELASLDVEDTKLALNVKAGAQLDTAIPLTDPSTAAIKDSSGLDFEAQGTTTAGVGANLGPFMVTASGDAKAAAGFTATFDGTDFNASLGSLAVPQDCGTVSNTLAGKHDGAADAIDLSDSTATFGSGLVGGTLDNVTQSWSCTIQSASGSTVTCDPATQDTDGMDLPDELWAPNDDYLITIGSGAIMGDACAALTLTLNDATELGKLGWSFTFGQPDQPEIFVPPDLLDQIQAAALDPNLLFGFLPTVVDNLSQALQSAESVPLVGEGLKDIGNATKQVNDDFVKPLAEAAAEGNNFLALKNSIKSEMEELLFDEGEALLVGGTGGVDGVEITGTCNGAPCGDGDPLLSIDRIQMKLVLGQFGEPNPDPADPDFSTGFGNDPQQTVSLDWGIPGLPVEASGKLAVDYGWRLPLVFGVDRFLGPFIVAGSTEMEALGDDSTGFRIGANVKIGDRDLEESDPCLPLNPNAPFASDYSSDRCINARLGFLDTYIFDNDGSPSNVALFAFANLESAMGGPVPLCELLSGTTLNARIRAQAALDVAFQTGIQGSLSEALPSVLGTLALGAQFEPGGANNGLTAAGFDNLHLDPGKFVENLIEGPARKVKEFTSPLKPPIDVIRTPLPVISDLSQMAGGGPITLLSVVELQNCPPPFNPNTGDGGKCTKLLRTVIEIIDFVNNFNISPDGLLIALDTGEPGGLGGSFDLDVDKIKSAGKQTPDQRRKLIDTSTATITKVKVGSVSSTPASLTFPFLSDSSQIFGLLLGDDIVLVRFDAGTLQANAGLSYNFGPFFVGPVPVVVTVGGSVALEARFAAGFDTSGIRKGFDSGFGGIIDGVFIDDLDASGNDVPEITLIGEVFAGAGVELGLAAAGIKGGIRLTSALDLDDPPPADGKLRIEEIVDRLDNPLCLFVISGRLEAFLGAWVRVGLEWFSKEWDIEFVNVTLLEFEVKCDPPPPRLADTSTTLATVAANRLRLNIGSNSLRQRRGVRKSVIDEKVVVRQTGGREFEVSGFGLTQTYRVPGAGAIVVWARGDDGKDDISLLDGVDRDGNTVPFTAAADIWGEAGNDRIKTARGADKVCGNEGNDKIETGPNQDRVAGGAGNDNLSGGGGDDRIYGDAETDPGFDCGDAASATGNDVITGGAGGDTLDGGPGDDNLNGGWPGTQADALTASVCNANPDFPDPDENPQCDDADVILGGLGDDVIEGRFGADVLYGDLEADGLDRATAAATPVHLITFCPGGNGDGGRDSVSGGAGDDRIWGGFNPFNADPVLRHEVLGGEKGNDFICGNGGNDLIDGDDTETTELDCISDCHDHLFGGPDHDGIFGRVGNDRLFGGPGNDELFGGNGADDMAGGLGRDLLFGELGNDVMLGEGNAASLPTQTGFPTPADRGGAAGAPPLDSGFQLDGVARPDGGQSGPKPDCFLAGDGTNVPRIDLADGDLIVEDGNADCLFGGPGNDLLFGGDGRDQLFGDLGDDFAEGNNGDDDMRGGKGNDVFYGHRRIGNTPWRDPSTAGVSTTDFADADTIFGDSGMDDLYGGPGNDVIRGNADDDYLEGNQSLADGDMLFGDGGGDDLIGGSSISNTPDGKDTIFGNTGPDYIVGDNATIVRPGGNDKVDGTESARRRVTLLADFESVGAGDELHGNPGNDVMWGGFGADTMTGDAGDDHMEGNGGGDTMHGNAGQDDLIGGTGRRVSTDPTTAIGGFDDDSDHLFGGDGGADADDDFDVIAGDNAEIDRPLAGGGEWLRGNGSGSWQTNTFNAAKVRRVKLLDVAEVGGDPVEDSAFGDDDIHGEADDDEMWGQGGNDTMAGGPGDDIMMGNDGADTMSGDEGDDDMHGGTGLINGETVGVPGRHDGPDEMHGGDGFDVMAGDNAVIRRVLVAGGWVQNTFDDGTRRQTRVLLDIDSPDTDDVSGPDRMWGDEKNDLMYGQGQNDEMHGGTGDDLMEGNADADQMTGDSGQDDMIGGTVQAGVTDAEDAELERGDLMNGNQDADVMLGDNGRITRPLDGGHWQIDPNTNAVIRRIELFDVQLTSNVIDPSLSGGDVMAGDESYDLMFGQGAGDRMEGGGGDDVMEGNHGADLMWGDCDVACADAGEDDMIGGGSANDGVIGPLSVGNGLADGDDTMEGGGEGDVMAGDNARITRVEDDDGLWIVDANSLDVFRDVVLFDVQTTAASPLTAAAAGSDIMSGQAGRDLMFGQGNADPFDDDLDGSFSEDPSSLGADWVDNDRDGRESPDSLGYDCEDRRDNDGDGLIDLDDPECAAAIDEDGGGDVMMGGAGDDYMEGNHGGDLLFGDDGEDDIVGGSSAGFDDVSQGSFIPGVVPVEDEDGRIAGRVPPTDLEDAGDVIDGGPEDDVIAADNAIIIRPTVNGLWQTISGGIHDLVLRTTLMDVVPEMDGAFGDDYVLGAPGDDEIYGQLGDDFLLGHFGDDVLIGDLGQVTSAVEDGSREETIATKSPFLSDDIFVAGTLFRLAELFSFEDGDLAEGHDTLLGGDGNDSLHGGAGDDILNGDGDALETGVCSDPIEDPDPGTPDEDHLFAGDGDDVLWGGRGHDHLWGGHGDDHLDVKPRESRPGNKRKAPDQPADPAEWHTYGAPENFQGLDIIHGAWDRDAMQADEGGAGPTEGDRMIDWAGAFNVFYVCPPEYGEGYITRIPSPDVQQFLERLSASDGAFETSTPGTSGFRELGYVFHQEIRFNSHPPHPDHPGHFTCVCDSTSKPIRRFETDSGDVGPPGQVGKE